MADTATEPAHRGPLIGVLSAIGISLAGTRIASIALPWFVLSTTGSIAQTGLLTLAQMTPYVIVKALSGPLIDDWGPRRVSIGADLISTVCFATIPALWYAGLLPLGLLLVLVAVMGAVRGPGDSAKEIFTPQVAAAAHFTLQRVTGILGSVERLSATLGPAGAGLLIAFISAPAAIGVTAGSFSLGAVLIALSTRPVERAPAEEERERYLSRLTEGIRFIRRDRLLSSLIVMIAITNLLDTALFATLLPVWARNSGHGPLGIGILESSLGGCAILGSIVAAIAQRLPRRTVYFVSFAVAGLPRFLVLAFHCPLLVSAAIFGVCGLGLGFINPIVGAILFERVPTQILGRVHTLGDAVSWSLLPFGGLLAAALVGMAGLAPALVLVGLAYFLATSIPATRSEWREMQPVPAQDPQSPTPAG